MTRDDVARALARDSRPKGRATLIDFPRALAVSVALHLTALAILVTRPSPAVWGPIIPVTLISLPGLKAPEIQPAPAMPEKAKANVKETIPAKPASSANAVPRPTPTAARPAAPSAPVAGVAGPMLSPGMQDSPFSFYLQILTDRVNAAWQQPPIEEGFSQSRRVEVMFRLLPDGQVEDVRLRRRSGDDAFDASALRAIQSAAPFPPLPEGFPEPEATRISWRFRR